MKLFSKGWFRKAVIALMLTMLVMGKFGVHAPGDYERQLLIAEGKEAWVIPGERGEDTAGQAWLLLNHGLGAYLAGKRYPETTEALYYLFGETEEFTKVLHTYGHEQVIPVVYYFLEHESVAFEMRTKAGQILMAFKRGEPIVTEELKKPLMPEERAWIAISRIMESGNNFLARFVVGSDGKARPLYLETTLEIAEELFFGNLNTLEKKYKLGEKITLGDVTWAGVDVAALVLTPKTLGLLKTGRIAAAPVGTVAKCSLNLVLDMVY
ncbi:MAG: hypothetical protein HY001_05140 [Candidatus Portnoybacteria bacterium]|nr:hypothetical protein [Candidatus Portnoybacteria bacterium]